MHLEKKGAIELDGGQNALDPGDKIRDEWLWSEGDEETVQRELGYRFPILGLLRSAQSIPIF